MPCEGQSIIEFSFFCIKNVEIGMLLSILKYNKPKIGIQRQIKVVCELFLIKVLKSIVLSY